MQIEKETIFIFTRLNQPKYAKRMKTNKVCIQYFKYFSK